MILEINNNIKITEKDMERYDIIQKTINKNLTNKEAGALLNLSTRQIKRLKREVRIYGIIGLIHKNRGKPSNRKIKENIEEQAEGLLKTRYYDFSPTFASEKLEEEYGILINKETIRLKMIKLGLRKLRSRKNNKEYRCWRDRKSCCGEMIQLDGSYHDWFENKQEECLIASIDDATSCVEARFEKNEGVSSIFQYTKDYCFKYGKPISIYLDKFSTYKVNNNKDEFNDVELKTKFGKVADKLNIKLIFANSPQAKGRIERLFKTLQDRLVKELRLNNIKTTKDANIFLKDVFLPKFNKRFMVIPKSTRNLHRKLNKYEELNIDNIFSFEKVRRVNNDFTISNNNIWYQLEKDQPTLVLRKDRIIVQTRIDNSIHLFLREKELNFKQLPQKPEKANSKRFKKITALQYSPQEITNHPEKVRKPSAHHPWRSNTNSIIFKERIKILQNNSFN